MLIPFNDKGDCGLADANGDEAVNAADMDVTIREIFTP